MNMQEYVAMKLANTINEESWDVLWRKLAFIEFDAALEEFVENEKERWEQNGGDSLMDVSTTDVECIIDEYINRTEELFCRIGTEEMRNAIQAVTGLIC